MIGKTQQTIVNKECYVQENHIPFLSTNFIQKYFAQINRDSFIEHYNKNEIKDGPFGKWTPGQAEYITWARLTNNDLVYYTWGYPAVGSMKYR